MLLFSWLLLAFSLVNGLVIIDSALASSCVYYLKEFNWEGCASGNGAKAYKCRCAQPEWISSVVDCVSTQNQTEAERDHAIRHVMQRCWDKGRFNYTFEYMESTWGSMKPQVNAPSDVSYNVTEAFVSGGEKYQYYNDTFYSLVKFVHQCQWLGWGLNWYWAAVVIVAGLYHWVLGWHRVPAFWVRLCRTTLPGGYFADVTLAQWIVVCVFLVMTVLSTGIGYWGVTRPNGYIANDKLLTLDLIGYRSAIIAFSLMPLTYFFAIRNNPFLWVTGLSYSHFSFYHKVLACTMVLEALIHAGMWTGYAMLDGGYDMWTLDAYWRWGMAGLTLIVILPFFSLRTIRNLMYETFLVFHKLSAILFIVAMWYHCNTLGWMGWVYALIGIIAYDRVVRVTRIVANGGVHRLKIEIAEKKVVRMVIPKQNGKQWVRYFPGCYCFVYFLNPKFGILQSHPFTVISSPVEENGDLVIYFKVQDGITKSIYFSNATELLAFIEGPYGEVSLPLRSQKPQISEKEDVSSSSVDSSGVEDMAIGLAAGMGICAVLPKLYARPASSKLYWLVSHVNSVNWIYRDLEWLRDHGCYVKLIVTGDKCDEQAIGTMQRFSSSVVVDLKARPDIQSILSYNVSRHPMSKVIVCGPDSLNQEARRCMSTMGTNVDLEIESFVW